MVTGPTWPLSVYLPPLFENTNKTQRKLYCSSSSPYLSIRVLCLIHTFSMTAMLSDLPAAPSSSASSNSTASVIIDWLSQVADGATTCKALPSNPPCSSKRRREHLNETQHRLSKKQRFNTPPDGANLLYEVLQCSLELRCETTPPNMNVCVSHSSFSVA